MKTLLLALVAILFIPSGGSQPGPVFRSYILKAYNDSSMAKPAGVQDGDVLLYFGMAYYDTEADSPESHGWTKVLPVEGALGAYRCAYYRVASSEPANYDNVFGHYTHGCLLAYRNFTALGNVGTWATHGGTSRSFTAPAGPGTLVAFTVGDSPYATYTFPAGMTVRTQYWAPNVCDQPNGGDGGTRTWVSSISADIWCLMVLIR